MKTLSIFTILLTFGISFSSFVVSRQLPVLEKQYNAPGKGGLRIHRQGSGVALSWAASASAVSFRIERSQGDPDFFETLCELPNNGGRSCNFKDESVFPGDVYYKVISINADGSEESSEVASIRIRARG